jgi:magnesium-dependent phosphatase-1
MSGYAMSASGPVMMMGYNPHHMHPQAMCSSPRTARPMGVPMLPLGVSPTGHVVPMVGPVVGNVRGPMGGSMVGPMGGPMVGPMGGPMGGPMPRQRGLPGGLGGLGLGLSLNIHNNAGSSSSGSGSGCRMSAPGAMGGAGMGAGGTVQVPLVNRSPRSPTWCRRQQSKDQAEALISKVKPKLLALDLDFTLWPDNCYENTAAPYIPCKQAKNRSLACMDPRTKQERLFSMYPEAREILEWLHSKGVVMTICSRSPDRALTQSILEALGLWDMFILPQVYRQRKTYHFRNLKDCLDVDYKDMLFFDDCDVNIDAVNGLGVVCCQVNVDHGLTWESLVSGLAMFAASSVCGVDFQSSTSPKARSSPALSAPSSSPAVGKRSSPTQLSASFKKHVTFVAASADGSDASKTDEENSDDSSDDNSSISSPRHDSHSSLESPEKSSPSQRRDTDPSSASPLHVLSMAVMARLGVQQPEPEPLSLTRADDSSVSVLGKRKPSPKPPADGSQQFFPENADLKDNDEVEVEKIAAVADNIDEEDAISGKPTGGRTTKRNKRLADVVLRGYMSEFMGW